MSIFAKLQYFFSRKNKNLAPVTTQEPEEVHSIQLPEIKFSKLEKAFKYKINNKDIFVEALTHRSYCHSDEHNKIKSNERMEFLGDSILSLIVAEFLYEQYPYSEEGTLTKIRSRLVNKKALIQYAESIKLIDFILIRHDSLISVPRGIENIVADAFEAILAAIYLDGGYKSAKKFIVHNFLNNKEILSKAHIDNNYKSALLEYAQALGIGLPKYLTLSETGPNHEPVFNVSVSIGKSNLASGIGASKKEAEQHAAKEALTKLSII
jgi:ribonuclease-3